MTVIVTCTRIGFAGFNRKGPGVVGVFRNQNGHVGSAGDDFLIRQGIIKNEKNIWDQNSRPRYDCDPVVDLRFRQRVRLQFVLRRGRHDRRRRKHVCTDGRDRRG